MRPFPHRTEPLYPLAAVPPIDSFAGPNDFLSNFYISPVEFEGETYRSVEHAFQAAKTTEDILRAAIRIEPNPGKAKRLGRKVQLRPGWDDIRISVMKDLLRVKFAPGTRLAGQLLATGSAGLVEGNHWNDRFWGVCLGAGENHLGKLLMQIRAELQGQMTARPAPLPMQEAPPGQMSAPRAGGDRVIPNFYPISCKTRPCMTAWGLQSIVDNGPDTCYIICPVVREGAD